MPGARQFRVSAMDIILGMRRCILSLAILLGAGTPSVRADEPPEQGPEVVVKATASARPAQTQWLDRVAEFFREPIVNIALITIGVIGLIFEFKLPGTTFPGSVAAICFVLFF